ncbi:cytochrome P450 [Phlebopus sp. FC_14]|nr:cytochrome P450 [Phlebopus sp. FC_14]
MTAFSALTSKLLHALVYPLLASAVAYASLYALRIGSRGKDLPPGPPTIPILGNSHIFPTRRLHIQFAEWAKTYGDIISLKIFQMTIIVLHSPSGVREIIDKRSLSSSNRPLSIISEMIIAENMNLGSGRFANETWRTLRKAVAQLLSPENFKQFEECVHAEASQLMWDLSRDPEAWYHHIHRFTTSFATTITYGRRSPCITSPDVAEFLHVHPKFLAALDIGAFPPVDLFPPLKYVPESWAAWKHVVKEVRALHDKLYGRLLSAVQLRLEKGAANGSFMEDMILNARKLGFVREEILMNLGAVVIQGSDTSSATLQNLVLCLVAFPEAQRKARQEIDNVIGVNRTPNPADIQDLPYTRALIEECSRFHSVGPLGLPHAMTKDEVVDGVLIPKNAIVFMNIWGMFHDPRYFDRPNDFMPERFLLNQFGIKPGVEDDAGRRANLMFGGGRRICPGVAFARASLEINAMNFIWAFEFLPALDPATGQEVPPNMEDYSHGITAARAETAIRIKPRSKKHVDLLTRQFAEAGRTLSRFEAELTDEDREFNMKWRRSADENVDG